MNTRPADAECLGATRECECLHTSRVCINTMQAYDLNCICETPLFAGCLTAANDSVKPVMAQSHNREQIFAWRRTSAIVEAGDGGHLLICRAPSRKRWASSGALPKMPAVGSTWRAS
jgi:hypothetical protein